MTNITQIRNMKADEIEQYIYDEWPEEYREAVKILLEKIDEETEVAEEEVSEHLQSIKNSVRYIEKELGI